MSLTIVAVGVLCFGLGLFVGGRSGRARGYRNGLEDGIEMGGGTYDDA